MLDSGALDHLCRLARLDLDSDEKEALRANLDEILEYAAVLQHAHLQSTSVGDAITQGVRWRDTTTPGAESQDSHRGSSQPHHWREDISIPSPDAAEALALAPERIDGHIAVPTVVVSEAMLSRGGASGDGSPADPAPSDPRSSSGAGAEAGPGPVRITDIRITVPPDAPMGFITLSGLEDLWVRHRSPESSVRDEIAALQRFYGSHRDGSLESGSAGTDVDSTHGTAVRDGALHDSAESLLRRITEGTASTQSVVEACFLRIIQAEPRVRALVSIDHEAALARAVELDRMQARGEPVGALHGLPVILKDNLAHRGRPLTCASRILRGYRAPYSATAVERLERAGAIVIGRANMDEFAMGSSCENSAYGPTANPWDETRVPGGSSGGSAAAVASGEAWASLGSDTGGSVRQPGAFCGLVALKPAYGRVSRYGLVAFASSLDQIGPIGRWARDVALVYNAIEGADPRDATTMPGSAPIDLARLDGEVAGLRLGIPRGWLGDAVDPEIVSAFETTVRIFENLGVEVREIELPSPRDLIATYYVIADAEASSNLARFDGVRFGPRAFGVGDLESLYRASRGEGFGVEVKRRILIGTFVLSAGYQDAFYGQALRMRRALGEQVRRLAGSIDAILMPTSPTTAFRLGEKLQDPLAMYVSDTFTIGANLLGHAAISFPAGKSSEGLPIGMQLYACGSGNIDSSGLHPGEETLLRLVRAHELASDGLGSLADPANPLFRDWSAG